MSSSSGGATSGRPPFVGRGSIYAPGYNDFDLRVSRNIPIYEKIYMQFSADAFNLLNHQIITGVNSTLSSFVAPGASVTGASKYTCQTASVPTGSTETGCYVPYTGTGLSAFGVPSSTSSSSLYGARQLQMSAKLIF
jgi:hypothetical protein